MTKKLLLVHSAVQLVTVTDDPRVTRLLATDMTSLATKSGPVSVVVDL